MLSEAGFEVIGIGHATAEKIVATAVKEDVDLVGLNVGGRVEVVERLHSKAIGDCTLIACQLETGRTHQIRIHLSEAGHPVVGERVYIRGYRGTVVNAPRLMLHAAELGFVHPATNNEMIWKSPLPQDMEDVLASFIQKEARFLKPSFYKFSNDDIIRMIEERDVKTFVRPNGRVFPVSGNADDVMNALAGYLYATGVEVKLNSRVRKIFFEDGKVSGLSVRTPSEGFEVREMITENEWIAMVVGA